MKETRKLQQFRKIEFLVKGKTAVAVQRFCASILPRRTESKAYQTGNLTRKLRTNRRNIFFVNEDYVDSFSQLFKCNK